MRWHRLTVAGDGPGPRSSHAAAAAGGALFVYGGELQPRVPVDAALFELFELADDGPGPRVAAGMAAVGSKIYLFGGRTGVEMGEGARDDLWELDTAAPSPSWRISPCTRGAPPPARSYHAVAAAAGRVYVFGGCGAGGRLRDLWRYDPREAAWEEMPAAPEGALPRGGAALVASPEGDALFVLGGFSGRELGDCHAFDTAARAWRPAPEIPPRSVFGAAVHACGGGGGGGCRHAGHVVLFGGEVDPSTQGHAGAGGFSAEVHCIDPKRGDTHAVTPAPDAAAGAPCARGWFASASVGGSLVVCGGVDTANVRLDDVWVLAHA
ncbi:hypothetical protein Rsub_09562 [Raphidocelis subcapitata]|uniref:Galactose oxidase n=1 Tax=Raphidocelis subcapitata TaxID=307507 RepID=A0A2V0PJA8_9CHLO|nr:hypothetical protein Rsub_09562 [Raphidocelis subcapitata]|eukprot:GBF97397.1 hypothetical protein Rsub_09562 [Raphidocelis subcapitata]